MKSDSLFYQMFQKLPELLGQLLGDIATENYTFHSVEVKGLARRIDGVFLPPTDKAQNPLYFVEIQFQADEQLYERLFTETFLYLGQYRPQKLWYCVALWSSQTLDKGIPPHYQRLYETGFLKIIYLDQLPNRMTLGIDLLRIIKAEVKNPLEIRAEILNLRQMAQQLPSETKIKDIIELIDNVILCKFPQLTREELKTMFDLVEIQQTRVYQDARQEGKLEGKLEGRLEGKLEGKLEAVPLLFQAGLSPEVIAQKLDLNLSLVEQVIHTKTAN